MTYKGYIGQIDYDDEADIFHGEVLNTRDVITFQGRSAEELRAALADSVEEYLAFCAELGKSPDKPFSGQFRVRLDPTLHRDVAVAAARAHKSLNTFVRETLAARVHEE